MHLFDKKVEGNTSVKLLEITFVLFTPTFGGFALFTNDICYIYSCFSRSLNYFDFFIGFCCF